jgi:hypothetical protein
LPGNAGLIRKGRSYGLKVDEQRFAEALLSAAQGRPSEDERYFRFASVLADAPRIGAALAVLQAPTSHTLERVRARIALFGPPTGGGGVSGYIVVGGSSGGFAFAEPEFFLNLAYFPSAPLATTIMEHEIFHAVQNMAEAAERSRVKKCPAPRTRRTQIASRPCLIR